MIQLLSTAPPPPGRRPASTSMRSRVVATLEKLLTALLVGSFLVPLLLTLWFRVVPDARPATAWLRNAHLDVLAGVPPLPPLSRDTFRTAAYQAAVAEHFDRSFPGRELLIRLADEFFLRVFRASPLPVVIGKGPSLFLNDGRFNFVSEYTTLREPPGKFRRLVKDLRRFQENCERRGVGFAVLITPTKASIMPEQIPDAWMRRYDPRPRDYDNFLRLLRAAGVRHVDGHVLTVGAKRTDPGPIFPPGGIHWDEYGAMATGNGLLAELAAQGQPLAPVSGVRTTLAPPSVIEDVDMLGLTNFATKWKYKVAHLDIPAVPLKQSRRPSLVFVGGSFVGRLAQVLYRTQQFSEIDWLRYFREAKEVAVEGGLRVLSRDQPGIDVKTEIFAADCVVLEINEQYLLHPQHLREFLAATLPRLPKPGAPPTRFAYSTLQPIQWNEVFPLVFRSPIMTTELAQGFAWPELGGIWTTEQDATLMLGLPLPTGDARLRVACHAALDGTLPFGERDVDVYVNGEPVGAWAFRDTAPTAREVLIPRSLIAKGRCVLRLHFREPPAAGDVPGKLPGKGHPGLFLNSVCFTGREAFPYECVFYGPGVLEARNLTGFTREAGGLRANQQDAAVRVALASGGAAGDVRLRCEMFAPPVRLGPVFVFVNDEPVDVWSFDDVSTNALCWRELVIPKRLAASGGGCTVRFHLTDARVDVPAGAPPAGPGFLVTRLQMSTPPAVEPAP